MKHSNLKIFGVLACMAVFGSCVKELEEADMMSQVGDRTSFKAINADNDDDTRTVRNENGSVWWSAKESIRLFYGTQSFKFTSTNTSPASSVTFVGSLEGLAYNNTDKFWALYPYSSSDSFDGAYLTMTLPSSQKAVAGSFDREVFPCVARSTNFTLSFRNVCGGIKFCVSKEGVAKVTFKGNLSEPLAGKVKVGLNDSGIPFVSEYLQSESELTLSAPEGQTLQTGAWYHLVSLPVSLQKGYTMTLYFTDGHSELVASNKAVDIRRSYFGKLTNVDEKVAYGGDQSTIYLGIIGFNSDLTRFPIKLLSRTTKPEFDAFIDGLTMKNGTLLYYSVNESLNSLVNSNCPEDLGNASLITFTDGLDRGTPGKVDNYPGNTAYLNNIHNRILNDKVSGRNISAWSIGLKGQDVTDDTQFDKNLTSIASSSSMALRVDNMTQVNNRFQEIATHFRETIFRQSITVEIPSEDNGTRIRFTLDGATSATSSKKYIEGYFNLTNRSLYNLTYYGLDSTTGSTLAGQRDGIFTIFTFWGLTNKDGLLIQQENIGEWLYQNGKWVKNSEFVPSEQSSVTMEKKAAVIILNLDCSTSLDAEPPKEPDFPKLQESAKAFIETLCRYTITASSVSLDKQSIFLTPGYSTTLTAEVLPENAINRDVRWSSSDEDVAKVSYTGKVTALKQGTAIIKATTLDGGITAQCVVTVISNTGMRAIDLGLSVKWASANLGASRPEEYGNYYAWGEVSPKSSYGWSNYRWCNGNSATLTKYNTDSNYGEVDYRTILEPNDDAAHVNLGGSWRMPTLAEFEELWLNCTNEWTEVNGVDGLLLYSKKPGYTDNWIFFPCGGYRDNSIYKEGIGGSYVSSTLSDWQVYRACELFFDRDNNIKSIYYHITRSLGCTVRPVNSSPYSVSWVKLNTTALSLMEGHSTRLTATVLPETATNKKVRWTSSDASVATVSADGTVKALNAGEAIIKVITEDGERNAGCLVSVFKAVDLGLSVKWATCNVGADTPEGYGNYFAWGETNPKSNSAWSTYKWCNGTYKTMTKYCINSSYGYNGFTDNKTVLDAEDDAAHVNWGGSWRMPTNAEWTELRNNCTWTWTTQNGVNGYRVTSNKTGYTDKSIFLPAAGGRFDTSLSNVGACGYYWSSSLYTDYPYSAWFVDFSSNGVSRHNCSRYCGVSVRPVSE